MLFLVATVRLPVKLGQGRLLLLALFQFGVLVSFMIFLYTINKWAALFLLMAFVSRSYPVQSPQSREAFRVVLIGLIFFVVIYHFSLRGYDRFFMHVMCWFAVANCLAVWAQRLEWTSIWQGIPSGLMYNPNELSASFAICFAACMRKLAPNRLGCRFFAWLSKIPKIKRLLSRLERLKGPAVWARGACLTRIFVLFVLVGLIGAWSKNGVMAVCCAMIYWGYASNYMLATTIITGIGGVLFFFLHPGSISNSLDVRTVWWKPAIEIWPQRWGFGCGLGNWKVTYPHLVREGIMPNGAIRLHSTHLQGIMEMGTTYAVFTLGFITSVFYRAKAIGPIYVMALITIIVCGTVNSVLRMNAINAMFIVAWLAMIAARIINTAHKGVSQCQT